MQAPATWFGPRRTALAKLDWTALPQIPVLISAGIPRENAATCPTGTRSRPNPDGSMVLMAWRYGPARCGPTSTWVDWDASYPDFTSTIQARNEVNNKRIVNISGFPYRQTWVWQKPVMVPR